MHSIWVNDLIPRFTGMWLKLTHVKKAVAKKTLTYVVSVWLCKLKRPCSFKILQRPYLPVCIIFKFLYIWLLAFRGLRKIVAALQTTFSNLFLSMQCLHFDLYFIERYSQATDVSKSAPTEAVCFYLNKYWPRCLTPYGATLASFLSFAWSKLRLCLANHRAGYFTNLAYDWLSIVWAYSEQEIEYEPWSKSSENVQMIYSHGM